MSFHYIMLCFSILSVYDALILMIECNTFEYWEL